MSACVTRGLGAALAILLCTAAVQAGAEKVPALIKQLEDKKKPAQLDALKQLGKLGTVAREAVGPIARLLRDSDDKEIIAQAAASLAQIGPAAVPDLIRNLKDARLEQSRESAKALSRMGPSAQKAIPELIEALKDRDAVVRTSAAKVLGEIGESSDEVTLALFGMVSDPVLEVRQQAGLSILRVGRKAVPGLKTLLTEGKDKERIEAAGLLALMGPDAADALSDLTLAFGSPKPEVRASAARALGALKEKGKDAVPMLLRGLAKEKHPLAQEEIFSAVTIIGKQDVPGFMDELRRINKEGNWVAPLVLARFGPRGVDAVKPLIKMLKETDPGLRMAAAFALGEIGPEAFEALPHLHFLVKDPHPQVRGAAAQALFKLDAKLDALAKKQHELALEQAEKLMTEISKMIAERPFGPTVDRRTFFDPKIQKPIHQLIDTHVYVNSGVIKGNKDVLMKQISGTIDKLGPESIPALVYGVNRTASFRLGFC